MTFELLKNDAFIAYIQTQLPRSYLPPLPALPAELRERARTHASFRGAAHTHFEDAEAGFVDSDYGRLEGLGSRVLEMHLWEMILTAYPRMSPSSITNLTHALKSDLVLSSLSHYYHLPSTLLAHPAQRSLLVSQPSTAAELLRAYIGAIHQHCGYDAARTWVRGSMKDLLSLGHEEMAMREGTREKRRKADQLANGTMVNWVMLLEEWRMKKWDKREVEYRKLAPEGPPHHPIHVGELYIDNEKIGPEQRAETWKEAKQKLAERACREKGIDAALRR